MIVLGPIADETGAAPSSDCLACGGRVQVVWDEVGVYRSSCFSCGRGRWFLVKAAPKPYRAFARESVESQRNINLFNSFKARKAAERADAASVGR